MDKDLLRIVIVAIGGVVILGMILWSYFHNKKTRRGIDFYDKGNPLENIDDSLVLSTENDDFDIVPLGSAIDDEYVPDPITVASEIDEPVQAVSEFQPEEVKAELPKLIQFSLVAVSDEGFNGKDLVEAFQRVGLEYGSMKVFERLDESRRVDFAVASMVEPGTFPDTDLESFSSPGIAFFIQPAELDNPLEIFDNFIATLNYLATELDGVKWDQDRQPLSDNTIQQYRNILAI